MLGNQNSEMVSLSGELFPCPVCGIALDIRISCKQKPYCVCNPCGIQLFFRGKTGIERLHELVESGRLISGKEPSTGLAVTLYNRLQQLKAQREGLEIKQVFRFIFRDSDLDNAISAVQMEIERVQADLEKLARRKRARGER
jgi:uncharacterized small protein (DUF1192 family)